MGRFFNDAATTCPSGSYLDASGNCAAIVCPEVAYWDDDKKMCVPFAGGAAFPSGAQGGDLITSTATAPTITKTPFYKNWKFWAAVGTGVAVAAGGTVLYLRRS